MGFTVILRKPEGIAIVSVHQRRLAGMTDGKSCQDSRLSHGSSMRWFLNDVSKKFNRVNSTYIQVPKGCSISIKDKQRSELVLGDYEFHISSGMLPQQKSNTNLRYVLIKDEHVYCALPYQTASEVVYSVENRLNVKRPFSKTDPRAEENKHFGTVK